MQNYILSKEDDMRILQINSARDWAGGEVHTYLLSEGLNRQGLDVRLACRPGSAIDKEFREAGLTVVNLALKGALDLYSIGKLALYCRNNKIDIIHAHLGRDYWMAAGTSLLTGIPAVFTRHVLLPVKKTPLHRLMLNTASRIVAVSEAVKKKLVEAKLVSCDKVEVIYNGLVAEKFSRAIPGTLRSELGLSPVARLVGIVGQVSPLKGQEIFIRAIPHIIEHNVDVAFVVVGDDFKGGSYLNELRAIAKELGIVDKVFFLGQRMDIPAIMKDLDIFVLGSREAFGMVLIEAMAAGIPVIAPNSGGAREIVIPGETGVLLDEYTPPALAEAILRLFDTPEMLQRYGRAGEKRANELFTADNMTRNVINLYRSILVQQQRRNGK